MYESVELEGGYGSMYLGRENQPEFTVGKTDL